MSGNYIQHVVQAISQAARLTPNPVLIVGENIDSGSFRRECAENGRRAIRHGFDWAEDASRMVSFLERLAAGGDR